MRTRLRYRALAAVTLCIAAGAIAGCAAAPGIDGGIVGTGNRIECESQTKTDGTQAPLPEECKRRIGL
jgi:hypothetical protein